MGGKCEIDGQIGYRGRLEYSIERDLAGTKKKKEEVILVSSLVSRQHIALRAFRSRGPEVRVIHASLLDPSRSWLVFRSEKLEIRSISTPFHRENLPPTLPPFSNEKKKEKKRKEKKKKKKSAQMETKIYVFHRWTSGGGEGRIKFPIRTRSRPTFHASTFNRCAIKKEKRGGNKGWRDKFRDDGGTLSRYGANFVTDKQTLPLSLGRGVLDRCLKLNGTTSPPSLPRSLPRRRLKGRRFKLGLGDRQCSFIGRIFVSSRGKSFLSASSLVNGSGELSPVLLYHA